MSVYSPSSAGRLMSGYPVSALSPTVEMEGGQVVGEVGAGERDEEEGRRRWRAEMEGGEAADEVEGGEAEEEEGRRRWRAEMEGSCGVREIGDGEVKEVRDQGNENTIGPRS